jgi:glycine cleavage system H protein
MNFPSDLKYDLNYNWVFEKNGVAAIGIIDAAAKKVKEFVFIGLPKNGAKIKKGEECIGLESVKWTGKIKSPLSGEVVEINMEAYNEPAIVNNNPYKNWLIKIKISNDSELKELMDSKKAKTHYLGV